MRMSGNILMAAVLGYIDTSPPRRLGVCECFWSYQFSDTQALYEFMFSFAIPLLCKTGKGDSYITEPGLVVAEAVIPRDRTLPEAKEKRGMLVGRIWGIRISSRERLKEARCWRVIANRIQGRRFRLLYVRVRS